MFKLPLNYVTMTNYDNSFQGVSVLFQKDNLKTPWAGVLSKAGKSKFGLQKLKSIRMSRSFSGGRKTI